MNLRSFLFFFLFFHFFAFSADARVYFVGKDGSDDNDGLSKERAFVTIQHAAEVAEAGDTVYVKGGVYRELIKPVNSGREGELISFVAMPGEKVVVKATDLVVGSWTQYKERIYVTHLKMPLGDQNAIFYKNKRMTYARWPNGNQVDFDRSHYKKVRHGGVGFMCAEELGGKEKNYYKNSILWMLAGAKWSALGLNVSASDNDCLSFSMRKDLEKYHNAGDVSRGDDNYFYLSGKLDFLDSNGEWYFDSNSNNLYFQFPDDPIQVADVEFKARDLVVDLASTSYISFSGFSFFGGSIYVGGDFNVFDKIHASEIFSHNGRGMTYYFPVKHDGIHVSGNGNVFKNGRYERSDGNIFLIDRGDGNYFSNNLISSVGLLGNYGAAFRLENSYDDYGRTYILNNKIFDVGRSGMHIIRPAQISGNELFNTNIIADDGAAIYMGGYLRGTEVFSNLIHDINWRSGSREGVVSAIYLDSRASDAFVFRNLIYNIGQDAAFRVNGPNFGVYIFNNTVQRSPEKLVKSCCKARFVEFNNILNAADYNFKDPRSGVYYLREGSKFIDSGSNKFPYSFPYKGRGPDWGAFEFGEKEWMPGFFSPNQKESHVSP